AAAVDELAPESLRDGFGMLIDALVTKISDVRLNHVVERVEITTEGVRIHVGGDVLKASDVIIATTADVARMSYPQASGVERDLLAVNYVPTFNIILDVDRDWLSHPALAGTYGVRVPPDEMRPGDTIASISIESGRKGQPTPGHETVQMMLDADAASVLTGRSPAEILERTINEAERKGLLPGVSRARRNYHDVVEIRSAIPQTRPGRFDVIRRYEQGIDPASRVKFAGDFRGFPRVGSAALAGVAAASETLNTMSARTQRFEGAISPRRSPRRANGLGDDLNDAAQGYFSALARWGESLACGDLRGMTVSWANGERSFLNGVGAVVAHLRRSPAP